MNEWILISAIIIAAMVVLGLILTLIFFKKKKEVKVKETNYQVFFIIGITWIPVGIVFMTAVNFVIGIAFIGIGISYLAIGLANRDKWKK